MPWGYDIAWTGYLGTGEFGWRILAATCDKDPRCSAITTTAWCKYGYPPSWAWNPRFADKPCAGTLVKLGEKCSAYSVCEQGCVAGNPAAPWLYRCTCRQGFRLSPDRLYCYGPPFGDAVEFTDVANFTQYFILTPEKHRSPHVWLFKGSRLAVAATIDTMQPALGDLTSVPLNDIITAGSNIVQTLQRVMAAADKIFKALPPPFPVRNGLAWANDTTLLDTRVLWEVSYETDSASFAYNAHAGSAGWTTRAAPLLAMLRSALAGQQSIDHEVLLALSQNYCSDDLTWALDWQTVKQFAGNSWATHSFVHASLLITLQQQLPDVQLLYDNGTGTSNISNTTQLLDYYEGVVLQYLSDARYSWDNTWALGEFPGEGDTMLALHAGLFVHLFRQYGGSDYGFVRRFAKTASELSSRLPYFTADFQRARDNYFIAASVAAAGPDLLPFFRQRLGWKISGGMPRYLKAPYNIPP
ncbi:hypothetical protein OEZ85_004744 [Tetradesmus obliquus]|uniref:Endo-1,3(4)-beta-glucanase n=1 Tax=Tetradesmus obliquus TaxID=3088 RepID=A0ABY8UPZ3_TETOB|nr:hypothetical protein OEZ85_004744 [Tetradesmus obliquus]